MAFSAATIATEMQRQLSDTSGVIWTQSIISSFVNEAQNLIVSLRPDSNAITDTVSLALAAKQSIPSGGIRLIDIIQNTGGSPVQRIDRDTLTNLVPDWTTETGGEIEFYLFDSENPTVFWVYPTLSGAGSVEMVYSKEPDEFTTSSTDLGISDVYISPILEFVYYRCLLMEGKGQDIIKATSHLNSFYKAVAGKTQADATLGSVQGAQ